MGEKWSDPTEVTGDRSHGRGRWRLLIKTLARQTLSRAWYGKRRHDERVQADAFALRDMRGLARVAWSMRSLSSW
jgi:hypothetical protein